MDKVGKNFMDRSCKKIRRQKKHMQAIAQSFFERSEERLMKKEEEEEQECLTLLACLAPLWHLHRGAYNCTN